MSKAKLNLDDKVDDGEMDLSMCNLQEVPVKEIAAYRKVYSLDLSNNHLVQVSRLFPTLTNLTKLDLSRNKLKKLPDNFGDLHRLKHLDLYKNELEHLPLSFCQLKNLKWLDLKDNQLIPAIKEAAGDCLSMQACQACAKNIVFLFVKLKEKVDEDNAQEKKKLKETKLVDSKPSVAVRKSKQQLKRERKENKETAEISSTSATVIKKSATETAVKYKKPKQGSNFVLWFLGLFSFVTFSLLVLMWSGHENLLPTIVVETIRDLSNRVTKTFIKFATRFSESAKISQESSQNTRQTETTGYFNYLGSKLKDLYKSIMNL